MKLQPQDRAKSGTFARIMVTVTLLAVAVVSACHAPPKGWRNTPVSFNKPDLWTKQHLTWSLDTAAALPPGISEAEALESMDRCFRRWQEAGVFTFAPAAPGTGDIVIRFSDPPDGKFDGFLGKMTKTYYPKDPYRGQIYLDPAEQWTGARFALTKNPISDWLPHQIARVLGMDDTEEKLDTLSALGPYSQPDDWALYELRRRYSPEPDQVAP
ncbi:MAG: matrixin family metalloprotease [Verrucomicrobiaceae bacterium]